MMYQAAMVCERAADWEWQAKRLRWCDCLSITPHAQQGQGQQIMCGCSTFGYREVSFSKGPLGKLVERATRIVQRRFPHRGRVGGSCYLLNQE